MFVLNSDITIGKFHFRGVHSVTVRRSIYSYTDTAEIELPSICRIKEGGKTSTEHVVTGSKFTNGDEVIIKLGYNGALCEEFRGFVKHSDRSTPLRVICEGYGRALKRSKKINGYYSSITLKALAQLAIAATDAAFAIQLECNEDITFTNIHLIDVNAADVIDMIVGATDGCLSAYFIQPNKLWIGLVYTKYADGQDVFGLKQVSYRPGYNAPKDNDLGLRVATEAPITISYSKKLTGGEKVKGSANAGNDYATQYKKILNHISSAETLSKLAREKQLRMSYTGYEGRVNAFLQPYASPGYTAYITDVNYPANNGTYLAESIEVIFGMRGARRRIEIGPYLNVVK